MNRGIFRQLDNLIPGNIRDLFLDERNSVLPDVALKGTERKFGVAHCLCLGRRHYSARESDGRQSDDPESAGELHELPEVDELNIEGQVLALEELDGLLQVIATLRADSKFLALDLRLHRLRRFLADDL
ncbi:MAG: hypothetical protein RLZZ40_283 [Actinomycetota bacterium]